MTPADPAATPPSAPAGRAAPASPGRRGPAVVRLLALALIGAAALWVYLRTPLGDSLRGDGPRHLAEAAGPWASLWFVLGYSVLIALWVPGSAMVAIGAAVFGPFHAAALNYVGGVLGGTIGFVIARAIGGDLLTRAVATRPAWQAVYERMMSSRGFWTIFYVRLLPLPFNAISYLAGMSSVRPGTYVAATALAILPGTVAFTVLLGAIKEAVDGATLGPLLRPTTVGAVGLYGLAAALPPLLGALALRYPQLRRWAQRLPAGARPHP